jgi:homoserine kinase
MLSKDKSTALEAEAIMKNVYSHLGLDYHAYVTTINNEGCTVL